MAYQTRTVAVGNDWTLITNKVAMLQFNNAMLMVLNDGTTPVGNEGFKMDVNEKHINNSTSITVWAKVLGGFENNGINSIRVAEDVV